MAQDFENLNKDQELYIMSFISNLSKNYFFRQIGY